VKLSDYVSTEKLKINLELLSGVSVSGDPKFSQNTATRYSNE
jgi:hypothetical protein